jgi:hypothetical protein
MRSLFFFEGVQMLAETLAKPVKICQPDRFAISIARFGVVYSLQSEK